MSDEVKQETHDELMLLARELGLVMRKHGGRSAMVRTFVDGNARTVAAVNLYTASTTAHGSTKEPEVEAREVIR